MWLSPIIRALALQYFLNGQRAVGWAARRHIPFGPHEPGLAEESVDLGGGASSIKHKKIAQRQVGLTVRPVVGVVALNPILVVIPESVKFLTVAGRSCLRENLFIRELDGVLRGS